MRRTDKKTLQLQISKLVTTSPARRQRTEVGYQATRSQESLEPAENESTFRIFPAVSSPELGFLNTKDGFCILDYCGIQCCWCFYFVRKRIICWLQKDCSCEMIWTFYRIASQNDVDSHILQNIAYN